MGRRFHYTLFSTYVGDTKFFWVAKSYNGTKESKKDSQNRLMGKEEDKVQDE